MAVAAGTLLAVSVCGAQETAWTTAVLDTKPVEYGAFVEGGKGLTDGRDGFKFIMLGAQAGKVLTGDFGPGPLRGNFEYGVQVIPFWQSYTPLQQRNKCVQATATAPITCSGIYSVGGTYTGASITPIILRWNLAGSRRVAPWVQGAGGVLWTNHKYPGFGGPPYVVSATGQATGTLNDNAVNADASVWNFTPQFGIGAHYFVKPRRSVDFSANAVHISSSSLGDRNPGVNVSVQFSLGYSWWK
jgi:lipid A 3-O-deacylase